MGLSVEKRKISIDVPTAGVRVQISSTPIYTPWVEFFTPVANAGNIFVGDSTVDNTWIARDNGVTWSMSASESGFGNGDYIDLSKYYVDTSSGGDDLIIEYVVGK